MAGEELLLLSGAILLVAFLYSSVGHAGASGYIAVLALWGADSIKPTALLLNIVVASIGSYQFCRAGYFSWRIFWPFAVLAVPCAFLGGYLALPMHLFKLLVGLVLILSAMRLLVAKTHEGETRAPARGVALASGAGLGLLAGLTGTGGGIFLTPLLILMRWATTKQTAAVSVVFILLNSLAGLAGHVIATGDFPVVALGLGVAAVVGGTSGSHLGSRRLPAHSIKRILALVLVIAGCKLLSGN